MDLSTKKPETLGFPKKKREEDPRFLWWIHSYGCCVPGCDRFPVHAHHVDSKGTRGSDRSCIPLCPDHHVLGNKAVHRIGRFSFEETHGLSLRELVERFNALYNRQESGPHISHIPPFGSIKFKSS